MALPNMQVASDALEVGSSVLLPPVVDRLDLLLSLLPEQPSLINTLTTGQVYIAYTYMYACAFACIIILVCTCIPTCFFFCVLTVTASSAGDPIVWFF